MTGTMNFVSVGVDKGKKVFLMASEPCSVDTIEQVKQLLEENSVGLTGDLTNAVNEITGGLLCHIQSAFSTTEGFRVYGAYPIGHQLVNEDNSNVQVANLQIVYEAMKLDERG